MKAWMVVTEKGKAVVWSSHVPIFWLKKVAIREMNEFGIKSNRVVRVDISKTFNGFPVKEPKA